MAQMRIKNHIIVPVLRSDERKYITYDVVNGVATRQSVTKWKLPGNVIDVSDYALQ